jgi:hypothetical protein
MGIDDANIYMVYMRNLARGEGFVFNIGGERVEGFTSFLWTVIGAGCYGVSGAYFHVLLLLLNVFVVGYGLFKLSELVGDCTGNRFSVLSMIPLFLPVLVPGYFDWTVISLMETGLWSAELMLITVLLLKYDWSNANGLLRLKFEGLLGLMLLTRPEAMLWTPLFVVLRSLKGIWDGLSSKTSLILMVRGIAIITVVLTALVSWRIGYFGFPFPNTYYAKVSSDISANLRGGFRYVLDSFKMYPFLVIMIFGLLLWIPRLVLVNPKKAIFVSVVFSVVVITCIIPLLVGGDHFGYPRFILPVVPILFAGIVMLVDTKGLKESAVLVSLVFFTQNPSPGARFCYQISEIRHEWDIAAGGRREGELLNEFWIESNDKPSIGVITAGGFAWAYLGPVFDLMGLNNVKMAHYSTIKNPNAMKNHASFSKDVFYIQRPDILRASWLVRDSLVYPNRIDSINLKFQLLGINEDERFVEEYEWACITRLDNRTRVAGYMNKSFLNRLSLEMYQIKYPLGQPDFEHP